MKLTERKDRGRGGGVTVFDDTVVSMIISTKPFTTRVGFTRLRPKKKNKSPAEQGVGVYSTVLNP